jgi:hypothetical protein
MLKLSDLLVGNGDLQSFEDRLEAAFSGLVR